MDSSNKACLVSPPLNELEKLRQPLTLGERQVLDFLLANLDSEWEIYIQPHMNGLSPDFVLLHPHRGIQIIEVKDWDLDAMESRWKKTGERSFGLFRKNKQGVWFRVKDDPFSKASIYKDELVKLYCPRLGESLVGHFGGQVPVLRCAIAMPNQSHHKVVEFLNPAFDMAKVDSKWWPLISADVIANDNINFAVPFSTPGTYKLMKEEYADDLRHWLVEPDLRAEQRQPLALDTKQRQLAESRTETGYRRIKGAAGSGKSQVLAAKAARTSGEGKSVLISTFNITLANYLRDLIVRGGVLYKVEMVLENVTLLNFHQWGKRVCIGTGNADAYGALWENPKYALDEGLAGLVLHLFSEQDIEEYMYDLILVDEGQDFHISWWNALRKALKTGGEIVLVADKTQNIYGTASAWTDEVMTGAGFRGGWAELDVSYRLPTPYVPYIVDFANRFIPQDDRTIPQIRQQSLALEPVCMKWIQADDLTGELCADVISNLVINNRDDELREVLTYSDIVFMASTNDAGLEVIRHLEHKNINVRHTFDKNVEMARRQKMAFFLGAEKIKATTIHSFKGWESRLIVVQIEPVMGNQQEHFSAVYAALTRLKVAQSGASYITVVCSDPLLAEYGKTWPQ